MSKRDTLLRLILFGAWPLASLAQQKEKVWHVGFLATRHVGPLDSDYYGGFPRGMRELGYVEGKNLVIEWRSAEGSNERLSALAADLVRLHVDIIVTAGTPATSAAQETTTTIPIVIGSAGDPVGSGFVKSLAHPGGNITGLSELAVDVSPKLLEMLLSMVPELSRVVVLINPNNSSHFTILKNVQAAAQRIGVKVLPLKARSAKEIENVFALIAQKKAGAVIVAVDALFTQQARQIAELAAKNRLPAISGFREYAEAGFLMSYGSSFTDNFRRAATYVDRIFKGAKPGDLPVEQPTNIELIVNGKTAKALGLTIPQSLLIIADKVIE